MGQRHQIYFVLPAQRASEPPRVVGLHHQWLYGSAPLRRLDQLLAFVARGVDDAPSFGDGDAVPPWMRVNYRAGEHLDDEITRTLHAIYGLDLAEGDFRSLHTLDAEQCANPLLGDNNDGITIVDLRKPSAPRIAFATFGGYDASYHPTTVKLRTPSQYLAGYYSRTATNNDDGKLAPEGSWELAAKLDALPQLTRSQLRRLFPAMLPPKARNSAA